MWIWFNLITNQKENKSMKCYFVPKLMMLWEKSAFNQYCQEYKLVSLVEELYNMTQEFHFLKLAIIK